MPLHASNIVHAVNSSVSIFGKGISLRDMQQSMARFGPPGSGQPPLDTNHQVYNFRKAVEVQDAIALVEDAITRNDEF